MMEIVLEDMPDDPAAGDLVRPVVEDRVEILRSPALQAFLPGGKRHFEATIPVMSTALAGVPVLCPDQGIS